MISHEWLNTLSHSWETSKIGFELSLKLTPKLTPKLKWIYNILTYLRQVRMRKLKINLWRKSFRIHFEKANERGGCVLRCIMMGTWW